MKQLKKFCENFTDEIPKRVEKIRNKYYQVPKNYVEIDERIEAKGIFLGEIKVTFKPSLYLLEWLSKRTENKIYVNDKAEWLFLCGRDVFIENIEKERIKSRIFLVQNEKDENLGLGIEKESMIKNLKDRGDFLRREMN
ncbi:MAG: hypothetical protein ACMXX7_00965 [Candidatus Woesearchaeota archaeon]